ncbi:MAG: hypothetical protein KGO49_09185 [Gammaproteobacteria bacterium]|nr:hypothetical protein [Gammaproteobacteria bacterium]
MSYEKALKNIYVLLFLSISASLSGCISIYKYASTSGSDPTILFEVPEDKDLNAVYKLTLDPSNDTKCKSYADINWNGFSKHGGMLVSSDSKLVTVPSSTAIGVLGVAYKLVTYEALTYKGVGRTTYICHSYPYLLKLEPNSHYAISMGMRFRNTSLPTQFIGALGAYCPLTIERISESGEREDVTNKLTKLPLCQAH